MQARRQDGDDIFTQHTSKAWLQSLTTISICTRLHVLSLDFSQFATASDQAVMTIRRASTVSAQQPPGRAVRAQKTMQIKFSAQHTRQSAIDMEH